MERLSTNVFLITDLGLASLSLFRRLRPRSLTKKTSALCSAEHKRLSRPTLKTAHELVLKTWGKNFIKLRYPYEDYEHVTEGEFIEMGEEWLALGAVDERAMTVLYPNELFGMMEALLEMTNALE